ncbi:MAG: amidohydrolase [Planctomycetota bacterium]
MLSLFAFALLPLPQDLVLRDAVIHTGTSAPWRGDLVVRGGRIAPPGTPAPEGAVVRDVDGAFVVAGLQDAHGHLLGLGTAMEEVDLFGAKSYAEVVARVRAAAVRTAKGEWVIGRGWDQNDWPDSAMPHHRDLSAATPDNPVWLVRVDGHAALANARALHGANVQKGAVAPSGGEILVDEDGEPSGVLVDRAMAMVHLPTPTAEAVRRRLLAAQRQCVLAGITCVHDAGVSDELAATVMALHADGLWHLRSYLMLSSDETAAIKQGPRATADGLVQVRAVKAYADGALGSRGALLLEPYADKPAYRGLPLSAGLKELAQLCADSSMQLCVHAIGDAANRKVLDVFAATKFEDGARVRARWRIEHCQVVAEVDRKRFVELSVVPSMQPTHLTSDMPWARSRLGEERIATAYAWRAFHDLGLPVAFGSDFPVESVDIRKGLFAAVTTRGSVDGAVLRPDQQLDREAALRGFTEAAAFAMFAETELGTIEVGKRADLSVFDRDLRTCEDAELLTATVLLTIVDGKIVHESGK